MKLSTGKVAFPLQFDNGDVENIYINPHDKELMERINNFENSIQKRFETIKLEKYKDVFNENIDLTNLDFDKLFNMPKEELEKITKQTEKLNELDKELEKHFCEEIDEVFNSDVSSKAFKYVSPLSVVEDENGQSELYIILVLKAIAEEVQKYGNKMREATNKYVEKYKK